MKTALSAVCAFTLLACAWMFVMFFVLRHPGFWWRAAITTLLIGQTAATLATIRGGYRAAWLRPALLAGGAGIIAVGVLAFRANEAAVDWEGYIAVISSALVIQGVLTLATMARTPSYM